MYHSQRKIVGGVIDIAQRIVEATGRRGFGYARRGPSTSALVQPPLQLWAPEAVVGLVLPHWRIVPGIWDESFPDVKLTVHTEEAYAMTRRLAREEGILVGQSAGAAVHAALDLARRIPAGVIVAILPDAGDRYFSTRVWEG